MRKLRIRHFAADPMLLAGVALAILHYCSFQLLLQGPWLWASDLYYYLWFAVVITTDTKWVLIHISLGRTGEAIIVVRAIVLLAALRRGPAPRGFDVVLPPAEEKTNE